MYIYKYVNTYIVSIYRIYIYIVLIHKENLYTHMHIYIYINMYINTYSYTHSRIYIHGAYIKNTCT